MILSIQRHFPLPIVTDFAYASIQGVNSSTRPHDLVIVVVNRTALDNKIMQTRLSWPLGLLFLTLRLLLPVHAVPLNYDPVCFFQHLVRPGIPTTFPLSVSRLQPCAQYQWCCKILSTTTDFAWQYLNADPTLSCNDTVPEFWKDIRTKRSPGE